MTMYMMRHPFDSFGRSYDPFEVMSDLLDLDVPSVQYVPYHHRGAPRVRQPIYGVRAARSPMYVASRPAMPWEMSMAYVHPTSTSVYPSTVLSYLLEEQRRREELEEAKKRAQLASYLQLLEAAFHPQTHDRTAAAPPSSPAIANTAASKKKAASQRKLRREQHHRQLGGEQLASSPSQPAASPTEATAPTTSEVAPTASADTTHDSLVDASSTAEAKTTSPVRRDNDGWELSPDGAAYELRLPLAAGASVANVAMQVLRHPDARRSLQVSVDTEQRQHVRLAGGWPMVSVSRETTSRTVLLPEDASLEGVSVTTQTATSAATSQLVVRVPRSGEAAKATGASASEPTESTTVASDAAVAADEADMATNAAGSTIAPSTDDAHPSADDASQVSSDVTVEDVDEDEDEEESATSERR